jgi:hypothetical protein
MLPIWSIHSMHGIQKLLPDEPAGNRLFRVVEGAMLALSFLVLGMISGCLAMAAPMALNVTRAVVSGVSSSHRTAKSGQAVPDTEPCDMGERPLPHLLELRTDNLGMTTYRPLSGPVIDRQAQPSSQIGNLGPWRAMGDPAGLNFQPPLKSQLTPSSVVFLAYAPAQVHSSAEQSELEALNHDFGPVSGTFDWDKRVFLYSVVHQLPCGSSKAPASERLLGGPMRVAPAERTTGTELDNQPDRGLANPAQAEPEQPEGPEQPRR